MPTKKDMDDLYAQVSNDARASMAETDALVKRDVSQYFDDLDFEHRTDVQARLSAREMNESLTAEIQRSTKAPPMDYLSTPTIDSDLGGSKAALARGAQAFNAQMDLALQQNDVVGGFGRDVARAMQRPSQIDPAVDNYLQKLYATQDSFAARLRDPNIGVGTDPAQWQTAGTTGIPGRVVVRPDGSYLIQDQSYLKPLNGGQELMLDQQRAFEKLDQAYNEIPLELRQKSMSVTDTLTLVSLAAGAGEVVAIARGMPILARTLGALGNSAEYASDIARGDYSDIPSDFVSNQLVDRLESHMPGQALKAAVALESLSLDVAQAAQRVPTPFLGSNPNAIMNDQDWASLQGINPLVIEFSKP